MPGSRDTIDKLQNELAKARAELKACRAAAHAAENNLDAFFQVSRNRTLLVDPTGVILAANRNLAASVDLTPADMVGKSMGQFLPKDIFESRMEQIQTVVATATPLSPYDIRKGQHLQHSLYPVIENGEVVRIAICVVDISAELKKDAELEKASRIHSVLYEIARLGLNRTDLYEALKEFHHVLERELSLDNFFVALINEEADTLEFQYCADQTLSKCPTVENISSTQTRRLSLLPVRNNDLVLASKADLIRWRDSGEVDIYGVLPETWLGIPLTVHGKPIGVMVSQDYDRPRLFSDVDIQLIRACADQLARAIEQIRYEELSRFTHDIYQNIPSGLIIYQYHQPDRLYLFDANTKAEKLTGMPLGESKGKEFSELWPTAEKKGIRELLLTPIRTGKAHSAENLVYDDLGLQQIMRVVSFPLPGNKIGVAFEDISEEKNGELAIRKSEEYFRAFFEHNHTVMLIVDPKSGQILNTNLAASQYYGYSRESLLKMNVKEISTMAPSTIHRLMEDISGMRVRRFITRHKLADGGIRDVEVFSGPFEFDAEWKLISIVHDITDRLKTEAALSKAKNAAEQANRSKDEFLANISHEVRTPLNGVMGMLQVMLQTPLNEEQAGFIKTALQSSRNLLRVLNDLLDFSKIEAGKLELYNEPFDLEALIAESVDLFRQQAVAAGLDLSWEMAEDTGRYFKGDEGRLRQVLFNLIGNAIKFTDKGHVRVKAYSRPTQDEGDANLFFAVEDSGVGIPCDKIDYIFESFSQVDGSLTRKYQGTGLGLPIVKRLVNLMGGTVSVNSECGLGTTILVSAHVEPTAPPAEKTVPQQEAAPTTPLRILLAEDEQVNRIMAKRLLEKIGHTVHCAENGIVCLEKLKNASFDLILMDIQMPQLNGLETAQAIRTNDEFRHIDGIPIIALTAHAAKNDMEAVYRMGMNGYISKPFELEDLKQIITSVSP